MSVYYSDDLVTLHHGDALSVMRSLPDASVDCCVTSPPYYGLRDYGSEGQYGLEASPAEYVETMRALFSEVRRVLADDGTLWLNIGDSYSGSWGNQGRKEGRGTQRPVNGQMLTPVHDGRYPTEGSRTGAIKPGAPPAKNLMGIPWRVAFALQDDGWVLRNDIIWAKPNPMPMSVKDRLNMTHEHVFLFAKRSRYWFDLDPIRDEPRMTPEDIARAAARGSHAPNQYATAATGNARATRSRPISEVMGSFDEVKGRNPGDVWSIPTQPFPGAHFAVMPIELARRAIVAGCKPGGTVLDPFSGSGTTGLAAQRTGRKYVGIDLKADYLDLSLRTRLNQGALDLEGLGA